MNWSTKSPLSASEDGRTFANDLLSNNEVNIIFYNHTGGGYEAALREMLNKWFDFTIDAGWEEIVVALNKIDQVRVAGEIKSKHQIK